jgi:hypothetical protein
VQHKVGAILALVDIDERRVENAGVGPSPGSQARHLVERRLETGRSRIAQDVVQKCLAADRIFRGKRVRSVSIRHRLGGIAVRRWSADGQVIVHFSSVHG